MKAVNLLSGILKAAILLVVTSSLALGQQKSFYETKRKPLKREYKCKQVGVQKISSKKIKAAKKNTVAVSFENFQSDKIDTIKPELKELETQLYASIVYTELEKVENEMVESHEIPLPQPVYFRFDTDELTYEDLHQIALAIEHLKLGKSIILEGHTDSHGTNEYNMALSLKRANKIKAMIVEWGGEGVSESAISIQYYGEEKPAVENSSSENRQMNRRVEFIVL